MLVSMLMSKSFCGTQQVKVGTSYLVQLSGLLLALTAPFGQLTVESKSSGGMVGHLCKCLVLADKVFMLQMLIESAVLGIEI